MARLRTPRPRTTRCNLHAYLRHDPSTDHAVQLAHIAVGGGHAVVASLHCTSSSQVSPLSHTPRRLSPMQPKWLYNLTRQGIGHTGIQDEEASLEDRSRTAPNTSPYTARTQTYAMHGSRDFERDQLWHHVRLTGQSPARRSRWKKTPAAKPLTRRPTKLDRNQYHSEERHVHTHTTSRV